MKTLLKIPVGCCSCPVVLVSLTLLAGLGLVLWSLAVVLLGLPVVQPVFVLVFPLVFVFVFRVCFLAWPPCI